MKNEKELKKKKMKKEDSLMGSKRISKMKDENYKIKIQRQEKD